MAAILVTGYRSFEIGIFQDNDKRINIIKGAIKRDFISYMEEGAEWFVFMGNLGFEFWVLEVILELRQEGYECRMATIFPFKNHGQNWNNINQEKLALFKQVDFVKYSYETYEDPSQFRNYNRFIIDNTDGAYLFYDPENETNLKYLVKMMQSEAGYSLDFLTFEKLNEILAE